MICVPRMTSVALSASTLTNPSGSPFVFALELAMNGNLPTLYGLFCKNKIKYCECVWWWRRLKWLETLILCMYTQCWSFLPFTRTAPLPQEPTKLRVKPIKIMNYFLFIHHPGVRTRYTRPVSPPGSHPLRQYLNKININKLKSWEWKSVRPLTCLNNKYTNLFFQIFFSFADPANFWSGVNHRRNSVIVEVSGHSLKYTIMFLKYYNSKYKSKLI